MGQRMLPALTRMSWGSRMPRGSCLRSWRFSVGLRSSTKAGDSLKCGEMRRVGSIDGTTCRAGRAREVRTKLADSRSLLSCAMLMCQCHH